MGTRLRVLLLISCLVGCEKPLRLPYITPDLHNWPKSYQGVRGLKLHVFHTGTLTVPERAVYQDGSVFTTRTLEILAFVIVHPRQGLVLFGTGLNRTLAKDPKEYLGFFLASFGEPEVRERQDIVSQLRQAKLPHEKVRHIIVTDLRFDHTGELESFPLARVVVTSAEHTAAMSAGKDELYFPDEYNRVREWRFVDFAGAQPLGTFRAHTDLFGDGSVLLIDAAGATAGGMAVLVRLPTAPALLCGNLAWTKEHYFRARLPGLLFDREAWWEKVWRLKKFKELVPALVILPDHDWAAVEAVQTKDMLLHPFSAAAVPREKKRAGTPAAERSKSPAEKSSGGYGRKTAPRREAEKR
ncbi:MAG: MBL fold metallo-hydrolase [Thermodesulfobacteriota bacterium]|jgi:glyoxylase-like metal-dependent hydrolase (beta-lactamase superfamily II)